MIRESVSTGRVVGPALLRRDFNVLRLRVPGLLAPFDLGCRAFIAERRRCLAD